jgi:pimeloyl-ACP methyl ester carboxylesterase
MRLYYLARSVIFMLLNVPGISYFEPPVRRWLRRKFGSEDYLNAGALAETFKRVVDQDLVPLARRIQAPTLLIWGDEDQDTPLSHARILEKAIPNTGLVIFEGAGHFSYLDRPLDFVRIVTNFLHSK